MLLKSLPYLFFSFFLGCTLSVSLTWWASTFFCRGDKSCNLFGCKTTHVDKHYKVMPWTVAQLQTLHLTTSCSPHCAVHLCCIKFQSVRENIRMAYRRTWTMKIQCVIIYNVVIVIKSLKMRLHPFLRIICATCIDSHF